MYHYVRDPERTAYPAIKARRLDEFERQLDHLQRTSSVVGLDELRDAASGGPPLPDDACLLTFDDGLVDHVEHVLPALRRRGLRGCFCIPARPILEQVVLDVQKSQFVVAASDDHAALGRRVLEALALLRAEIELPSDEELYEEHARPGRYDPPDTVFVKRLLQDALPPEPRRTLLDRLFAELVSDDERSFAAGLYLSAADVESLQEEGMDVAGHGYDHLRLALLDESGQANEIRRTYEFLERFGANRRWAMCYPYGSRDETTIRLLRAAGCGVAFRDRGGLATDSDSLLDLPRLDTNELPTAA